MPAYVIAQISIHDRPRNERYVAKFMPTLKPYQGRLLAADEHPEVTEGTWNRDKIIVIAFPDDGLAKAWAASKEYTAIAGDRVAATDGVVLLVQGVTGPG